MENLTNALKHLFKQNKANSNKSGGNMRIYRNNMKDLKLEVLLFTHFMYEDDDKLSFFEKNAIMKLVKEEYDSMPKMIEEQFKQWMSNPPSLGYILDFAKKNEYSYNDLDEAIHSFVQYTDSNSKYHPVIRSVRKKLILEKDFLKK